MNENVDLALAGGGTSDEEYTDGFEELATIAGEIEMCGFEEAPDEEELEEDEDDVGEGDFPIADRMALDGDDKDVL